jgi:phosphoglycolate phosphatase
MRTALAAGMLPVGAVWGFRGADELRAAGALVMAGSMSEVPGLLSSRFGLH